MNAAEAMAEQGLLITMPAPPDVQRWRDWVEAEMTEQARTGRAPVSFRDFRAALNHASDAGGLLQGGELAVEVGEQPLQPRHGAPAAGEAEVHLPSYDVQVMLSAMPLIGIDNG